MTNHLRRCARCGAHVLPLLDLAMTAKRAERALSAMRLAMPDEVPRALRQLASALACYSQTCSDGTGERRDT